MVSIYSIYAIDKEWATGVSRLGDIKYLCEKI